MWQRGVLPAESRLQAIVPTSSLRDWVCTISLNDPPKLGHLVRDSTKMRSSLSLLVKNSQRTEGQLSLKEKLVVNPLPHELKAPQPALATHCPSYL